MSLQQLINKWVMLVILQILIHKIYKQMCQQTQNGKTIKN